jgi:hypothetical protein
MNPNLKNLARETGNPDIKLEKRLEEVLVYNTPRKIVLVDGQEERVIAVRRDIEPDIDDVCYHDGLFTAEKSVKALFDDNYFPSICEINLLNSCDGALLGFCTAEADRAFWRIEKKKAETKERRVLGVQEVVTAIETAGSTVWYAADSEHGSSRVFEAELNKNELLVKNTICRFNREVSALCRYDEYLFCAVGYSSIVPVRMSDNDYDPHIILPSKIYALASVNGKLLASIRETKDQTNGFSESKYCLWDVLNQKKVCKASDRAVSMCAVPRNYFIENGVLEE